MKICQAISFQRCLEHRVSGKLTIGIKMRGTGVLKESKSNRNRKESKRVKKEKGL